MISNHRIFFSDDVIQNGDDVLGYCITLSPISVNIRHCNAKRWCSVTLMWTGDKTLTKESRNRHYWLHCRLILQSWPITHFAYFTDNTTHCIACLFWLRFTWHLHRIVTGSFGMILCKNKFDKYHPEIVILEKQRGYNLFETPPDPNFTDSTKFCLYSEFKF